MNKNTLSLTVLALSLVFSFVLVSRANAATYYVATTGSDANTCTQAQNINTPRKTIWGAVQCMTEGVGGRIEIRGGTYTDSFGNGRWIKSGASWSAATVIGPYNGESVTITPKTILSPAYGGTDPTITHNACGWGIEGFYIIVQNMIFDGAPLCSSYGWSGLSMGYTAHHVRLDNLEIKNFTGSQFGGSSHGIFTYTPSHHIEILNSNIHNNGNSLGSSPEHGIYFGSSDSLIEGNLIHDNDYLGLQFWGYVAADRNIFRNNKVYNNGHGGFAVKSFDSQIYNNLFYGNGANGIDIGYGAGSARNLVYNNVFYKNAGVGISVGSYGSAPAADNKIVNNIFMNNGSYPVSIHGGSWMPTGTIVQYNLLYGNGQSNVILNDGTNSTISNNTIADPKFVNAAVLDFHLQSTSPAINAGATLGSPYNVDFDGNVRAPSAYDIGALEYGGSGAPSPTSTCTNLQNSTTVVPVNFGASFNWFTNAKELLMNVICSGNADSATSATANIGNGSNTQYIYKTGYVWQNNQWTSFNYSGSSMDSGGNWFIGSANHSLGTLDLTQKQSVLSYICDWNGTSWKCGCHDNTCSTGYWNLQQFK